MTCNTFSRSAAVFRTVALAVACGAGLLACSSGPGAALAPLPLPMLAPRMACSALVGQDIPAADITLPTRGARVLVAELIAPKAAHQTATALVHATPEHCRVSGTIQPMDLAAFPIHFQLNIPTAWNQKSLQVGGGGLNGKLPENLATITGSGSPISGAFPPDAAYPLSQGYATFGGDSGHQDPGVQATWALNDEAWTNFAHAGLKKTHDAVFAVIQRLYGSRPRVSYFMGNSQGGREALEVAQRYPDDYDGVVAVAPLIGYTAHVVHKTLLATVQTGPGWIAPAKLPAIAAEVLRQCDALDGLSDGVISHYQACKAKFDPLRVAQPYLAIRCVNGADGGAQCVSDAQIATLNQMHAPTDFGFPLAHGLSRFPGYGTGREGLPGFLNIQPQPTPGTAPALGQPGATVAFGILKDPGAALARFAIAPHRDKLQAASALIDSTNPDLSRFFARGGRLIVKNSPADYASHPQVMMDYHDAVVARFGQATADAHLRYYVLPHTSHGGDGVSASTGEVMPQYVNLVQMAFDWVERGVTPPDAPVVRAQSRLPPHAVTATRPMCRYPLYPRYLGQGDPRQAANFVCSR
jgi:pimeloyl-ACP methyl ester carboxylesterase